jgi:protein-S-isoprenylcysteine O-methyltransferase Ste14
MYFDGPTWITVTYAAWFITMAYFLVSMFSARRITRREAATHRLADIALIWGGYVLIFMRLPEAGSAFFLPPAWRPSLGVLGAGLAVAGLAFTCWSRAVLGQYWSGTVALKADHKLIQSGPYRVVRHPLYTGLMTATAGTALALGLWRTLAGAALLWIAFLSRAHREDALLSRQFGQQFSDYQARSGRLLPRFRRLVAPD